MKQILFVLFLLIVSSVCGMAAPVLLIVQAPATVSAGQIFDVDINIAGATDLFDWQADLNYGNLGVLDVTEGQFLATAGSTFFFPGFNDPASGTLSSVLDTLFGMAGATGDGTLFTVSFQALAPGPVAITLSNVIVQDSTGADIPFSTAPTTVQVADVPEPGTFLFVGALFAVVVLNRRCRRSSVCPTLRTPAS